MKKILRIVITGGPCGGKTTALNRVSKLFEEEGYTVFLVSETATELILDHIKPFGDDLDRIPLIEFQKLVLINQLSKEKIRDYAAEVCQNDKVVIICDRGILDNRAYITHKEFEQLALEQGITEQEILDRYQLVLHMTTAAKGKEQAYILSNNEARTETINEAIEVDDRTINAWYNHPNRYIFENDCDFPEKMRRVEVIVKNFIKKEKQQEQARKLMK